MKPALQIENAEAEQFVAGNKLAFSFSAGIGVEMQDLKISA